MPNIHVEDLGGREARDFYATYPTLGAPAEALLGAVYSAENPLPPRVREAVRMRIAVANDCLVCRGARLVPGLAETFYTHIVDFRQRPDLYGEDLSAALDYAELFARDHLAIGEAQFERLRRHFDDAQIAALTVSCAFFLGFGRLTRVLMLEHACPISPLEQAA